MVRHWRRPRKLWEVWRSVCGLVRLWHLETTVPTGTNGDRFPASSQGYDGICSGFCRPLDWLQRWNCLILSRPARHIQKQCWLCRVVILSHSFGGTFCFLNSAGRVWCVLLTSVIKSISIPHLKRLCSGLPLLFSAFSPPKSTSQCFKNCHNLLLLYVSSGHPRPRCVCVFIRTDLEKFSITSLDHQCIHCSEWVPSEWESKQLIKTSQ